MPTTPDIEQEMAQKRLVLSMRLKVCAIGACFLLTVGLIAYSNLPNAAQAYRSYTQNELLKNIPSFQTYNNTDIDAGDGPQFWEWLNTDVKVSELYNTSVWQLENNHDTGYWENDDETYPDTEDFDIWSVDENL